MKRNMQKESPASDVLCSPLLRISSPSLMASALTGKDLIRLVAKEDIALIRYLDWSVCAGASGGCGCYRNREAATHVFRLGSEPA